MLVQCEPSSIRNSPNAGDQLGCSLSVGSMVAKGINLGGLGEDGV